MINKTNLYYFAPFLLFLFPFFFSHNLTLKMGKNKGGGYNLFESYLASGLANQSSSSMGRY